MNAKTGTVYLIATILDGQSEPYIFISESGYEHSPGWLVIGSAEVSIEIPSIQAINGELVVGLEEKISAMRATSHAAINEVESQIQSLKALPNLQEVAL